MILSGTRLSAKQSLHSHWLQSTTGKWYKIDSLRKAPFTRILSSISSDFLPRIFFFRLGLNVRGQFSSFTMKLSTYGLTFLGPLPFLHFSYGTLFVFFSQIFDASMFDIVAIKNTQNTFSESDSVVLCQVLGGGVGWKRLCDHSHLCCSLPGDPLYSLF